MPFEVNEAREKVLDGSIKFLGQTLRFEFQGDVLDEDWFNAQARAGRNEDGARLAELTCDALVSWDMTLDGEPVPLDPDTIADLKLPIPLFGAINAKMQSLMSDGGEETKKGRRRRSSVVS